MYEFQKITGLGDQDKVVIENFPLASKIHTF
jgi:hypothetical protein